MAKLERWERADNYMGENLSDYYVIVGRNRDSNYVDQSNFDTATKLLGGENEPEVIIGHFGHWACGWVELLLIHKDAKKELFELAERIPDMIDEDIILDWENYDEIRQPEIDRLYQEIKNDIENGNRKYWDCWGVDETMTDDELMDLVIDHVS